MSSHPFAPQDVAVESGYVASVTSGDETGAVWIITVLTGVVLVLLVGVCYWLVNASPAVVASTSSQSPTVVSRPSGDPNRRGRSDGIMQSTPLAKTGSFLSVDVPDFENWPEFETKSTRRRVRERVAGSRPQLRRRSRLRAT